MTIDLRSLPQKITELDIGIADQKSGRLLFEKGSYHYAYEHADSLPVSVTMQPQHQRLYNNGRLFPIFEMNLPEGYVRHRIAERLLRYVGKVSDLSVPQLVLSFIPKNPFADLTGANPTSIISVVIFAAFLGVAALKLLKDDAPKGERVLTAIDTLQSWVMKLVRLVMQLTPYGVLALMTKVVAGSNLQDIIKLGSFVVASYLGLLIMFAVHGILLGINGVSPLKYFRKVWPVLTFAFTSRSSAASIPLNVEAQTRRLGVPESIASFAASFGATIGQNGCAGLYPAMLAVMVAPTVGINPLDPMWIATLVGIVTVSSAGVAGVGGGATFAALIVLPAMGLPVTLVALLISVEPLIDMGRTALNVSGSMTAGTLTSQWLKQTDKAILDSEDDAELAHR